MSRPVDLANAGYETEWDMEEQRGDKHGGLLKRLKAKMDAYVAVRGGNPAMIGKNEQLIADAYHALRAAPSATVPFVERSESVNLARNIVEREVPLTEVTQVGIACLADAVLRMDAALRAAAGNHERNGE